jgi:TRAP-type uncharacterized transport system fused permease subunit
MRTGYTSMWLGWTVFLVPFLFVYSGTLLMQGGALAIAIDFVTALAAIWFISAAITGYSIRSLELPSRAVHLLAGVFLMLPVGSFAAARWFNIAGAAIAAAILAWEWNLRRRTAQM